MQGVNRRRGTKESKGLPKWLALLGVVVVVLIGIPWVLLHKKALEEILKEKANVVAETKAPPEAKALPGTSLVECTVGTAQAEDAANAANGVIRITVRHDLSPIASKVFLELVQLKHFDGVFVFRVLKKFVAQWGIRHSDQEPIEIKVPGTKDEITDATLSNVRATLSFAGGNPHTKQVFVNLGDNRRLDKENSRPFATVDEPSMEQVLDKLYTGYKDGQGQAKALKKGLKAAKEEFPYWSRIGACRVVSENHK